MQREIQQTENDLKKLEQQAGESRTALVKLSETGKKFQDVGDKISGVGTKLLPVSMGIAAIGTLAVKTGADFDSAMSKVASISGATGSEMDALRDKAREMGSKTKFSASEAADAMSYMAMAGWKTSDMLNGIEGIMNLAAASGEDLATTSDIVTDALTAFGLKAEDSGFNFALYCIIFGFPCPVIIRCFGCGFARRFKGLQLVFCIGYSIF